MKRLLYYLIVSGIFIGSAAAGGKNTLTLKKMDYLKSAINPGTEGFFIGPIGVRALMHHGDPAKNLLPQCWVNIIEKGSPAEGKFRRGDIILGMDGKLFTPGDPRIEIGNRIIIAETDGKPLSFMVFRPSEEVRVTVKLIRKEIIKPDAPDAIDPGLSTADDFEIEKNEEEIAQEIQDKKDAKVASMSTLLKGVNIKVSITLPVLGAYSETSPANCARTEKIIENGLRHLTKNGTVNLRMGLAPLALLATGEKKYIALVKKVMLKNKLDKGIDNIPRTMLNSHYHSWHKGYEGILLGEYYLLTGDKTFYTRLRDNAIRISLGQDDNGLWGHGFARAWTYRGRSKGRSIGYGSLNAAGLACFAALALAKKSGINDPRVDLAIKRASGYFRSYLGKGRIGYGFHGPSPGQGSNGKMGVAGAAYAILGDWEAMRYFSKCSMTYRLREWGHCGNAFNNVWGGLGSNLATTEGAASYYKTRRWYCTMVRSWDGSFHLQYGDGSQYGMGGYGDGVGSGGYMLNYLSSKRSLFITGKDIPAKEMLTKKDVEEGEFVFSFRKNHDLKTMKVSELMPHLTNWASGVRATVARELAKRSPDEVIPGVRKYLRSDNVLAGYGAARVAIGLKEESRPLWPDLIKVLETSDDYYLIKLCAQALFPAGEEAFPALMANSKRVLADEATPERHQSIHQTLLNVAWGKKYGASHHALEFIRKRKINEEDFIMTTRQAIAKGYGAQYATGISKFFSPEEMVMFFDALYYNITFRPADLNIKPFSSKYLFEETLPFIAETAIQKPYEGGGLTAMRHISQYGGHAKPYLPRLREVLLKTSKYIDGDVNDPEAIGKLFLNESWTLIDTTIKTIVNDKNPKKLLSLHDLMHGLVDKMLKGQNSKGAKVKALKAILQGPYWEYLRHAIALEKLVALDKEAAFEEVVKAIGPQENFKENMAVKLAVKFYPSSRLVTAIKKAEGRQLAGLVIAMIKSLPGKPAQMRPYLSNNDFAVRKAAYIYAANFGNEEDANIILNEIAELIPEEFNLAEAAIAAIHNRSRLSSGFFKRVDSETRRLVRVPIIDFKKNEGGRSFFGGVLRPSFSAIRVLSLSGKTGPLLKLRSDIESGRAGNNKGSIYNYSTQIDYLLTTISPLALDIDDGLDPMNFDKIKNYTAMVSYLSWEIQVGRLPKKFVRPVLDYLMARGKPLGIRGKPSLDKVKEVSAIEFQRNVNNGGIKVPTKNLLDPDDGGDFDDF